MIIKNLCSFASVLALVLALAFSLACGGGGGDGGGGASAPVVPSTSGDDEAAASSESDTAEDLISSDSGSDVIDPSVTTYAVSGLVSYPTASSSLEKSSSDSDSVFFTDIDSATKYVMTVSDGYFSGSLPAGDYFISTLRVSDNAVMTSALPAFTGASGVIAVNADTTSAVSHILSNGDLSSLSSSFQATFEKIVSARSVLESADATLTERQDAYELLRVREIATSAITSSSASSLADFTKVEELIESTFVDLSTLSSGNSSDVYLQFASVKDSVSDGVEDYSAGVLQVFNPGDAVRLERPTLNLYVDNTLGESSANTDVISKVQLIDASGVVLLFELSSPTVVVPVGALSTLTLTASSNLDLPSSSLMQEYTLQNTIADNAPHNISYYFGLNVPSVEPFGVISGNADVNLFPAEYVSTQPQTILQPSLTISSSVVDDFSAVVGGSVDGLNFEVTAGDSEAVIVTDVPVVVSSDVDLANVTLDISVSYDGGTTQILKEISNPFNLSSGVDRTIVFNDLDLAGLIDLNGSSVGGIALSAGEKVDVSVAVNSQNSISSYVSLGNVQLSVVLASVVVEDLHRTPVTRLLGSGVLGPVVTFSPMELTFDALSISDNVAVATIGDIGVVVTKFGVELEKDATYESATFSQITLTQKGSAEIDDAVNFSLYLDGEQVGDAVPTLDAQNQITFSLAGMSHGGLVCLGGVNHAFDVKADIVNGISSTVSFEIDSVSDVVAFGSTYGSEVSVSDNLQTSDLGRYLIIEGGDLTLAFSSVADTVSAGAEGHVFGTLRMTVLGEPLTVGLSVVASVNIQDGSSDSPADLTGIVLVGPSGNVVSPQNAVAVEDDFSSDFYGSTAGLIGSTVVLGDVDLPSSTTVEYTLSANVSATASANTQYYFALVPSSVTTKGIMTGELDQAVISPPVNIYTLPQTVE